MTESEFETDVIRKVYANQIGMAVVVKPNSDGLALVEINGGEDFGGPILLNPRMAILVGEAIIACAEEMLNK